MENSDDSDDDVGPAFDEFFETAFGYPTRERFHWKGLVNSFPGK